MDWLTAPFEVTFVQRALWARHARVADLRAGRHLGRPAGNGFSGRRDGARHAAGRRAGFTAGRESADRRRPERGGDGARRHRGLPYGAPVAGHRNRPAVRRNALAGRDHRLEIAVLRRRPHRLPVRRRPRRTELAPRRSSPSHSASPSSCRCSAHRAFVALAFDRTQGADTRPAPAARAARLARACSRWRSSRRSMWSGRCSSSAC